MGSIHQRFVIVPLIDTLLKLLNWSTPPFVFYVVENPVVNVRFNPSHVVT
jgi:hypothetical protein